MDTSRSSSSSRQHVARHASKSTTANGGRRANIHSSAFKGAAGESRIGEAASELFEEGRKMASELYHDSLNKVSEVQDTLKGYSDELADRVHHRPLTSLLIAAGIGFAISIFLRR